MADGYLAVHERLLVAASRPREHGVALATR
jgi:hypothetical protein